MVAIAYVQQVTGNTTTGTTAGTFGSATATGNLIVVTTSDDSGTTSNGVSVTDNAGNTYTKVIHQGSASTLSMWYCPNITGKSGHQITVTWSTAATGRLTFCAQEFSGAATTSPLDVSAFAGGTSTAPSVNSPATAVANELVVAGLTVAGTVTTTSAGSGYSNLSAVSVANCGSAQESAIAASAGVQTATFSLAASHAWIAGVLTFKPPAVAGPAFPFVTVSQFNSFH